jgi:hypothetical protein
MRIAKRYWKVPVIFLAIMASAICVGIIAADYREQTTRPSTGVVGTPALGVRTDLGKDLASGNAKFAILQLDSAGALRVTGEGNKATYTAVSQFACDSTATDIAVFPGSATVTAKILKVEITTGATGAAGGFVYLIRRSAADGAGTAVNAKYAQYDATTDTAGPTIVPQHYTAHPTSLGAANPASNGYLWGQFITQAALATGPTSSVTFDPSENNGGKLLRVAGSSDFIYLNAAAGLGAAGNQWSVTWTWTEGPTTE